MNNASSTGRCHQAVHHAGGPALRRFISQADEVRHSPLELIGNTVPMANCAATMNGYAG